jgi:hypothetical protein
MISFVYRVSGNSDSAYLLALGVEYLKKLSCDYKQVITVLVYQYHLNFDNCLQLESIRLLLRS